MIAHLNNTALALIHFTTEWPQPRLTVAVKGLFSLVPSGTCTIAKEPAELEADDLAPLKVNTDVTLSGHAPAQPQGSRQRLTLGTRPFEAPLSHGAVTAFARLPVDAPERMAKLGTFDQRWLDERWPYYPDDFDPTHFNAAPSNLQLKEAPRGDEALVLDNVHRLSARLSTYLPGLRVRAFLVGESRFAELPLRLDTVYVDTDAEQLSLMWRAIVDVESLRCEGIDDIYLATEPLVDEPLSTEHHQKEMALQRLARQQPADKQPRRRPPPGNDNEPAEDDDAEDLAELSALLKQVGAPQASLDAVAAAKSLKGALDALSSQVDPDPAKARQAAKMASEHLAAELEKAGEDPTAFEFPDEDEEEEDDTSWTRERVVAAVAVGESLQGQDLRGLDLSALDLTGAKLGEALLKGAKLGKSRLYDADLTGALLEGADLSETVLGNAKLVDADLTDVAASRVDLRNADLTGAVLDGAKLAGASLDEASAKGASFHAADLSDAKLLKADLTEARLDGAILHGADFTEAIMVDASIARARGEAVVLTKANLLRLRAGDDALLCRVDLRHADADESIWLGADLSGARMTLGRFRRSDLSRANLAGAALEGANCENADFTESQLNDAKMLGANFAGACFTSANLSGADARKANFFEAELWKANIKALKLDQAHLAATKLAPKEPAP